MGKSEMMESDEHRKMSVSSSVGSEPRAMRFDVLSASESSTWPKGTAPPLNVLADPARCFPSPRVYARGTEDKVSRVRRPAERGATRD